MCVVLLEEVNATEAEKISKRDKRKHQKGTSEGK